MNILKHVIERSDTVQGTQIIPIIRISINYNPGKSGIYFSSIKYPVAVILSSRSYIKVFKMTGEEATVQSLMADYPELIDCLNQCVSSIGGI